MILITLSVVVIALLIAVLAIYLFWVGVLLSNIADNLDDCNENVLKIVEHAKVIVPGVEHINRTGGVVAGALPLLYGGAERIAKKVGPTPPPPVNGGGGATSIPHYGRRRSRLMDTVGFRSSRH